jgi:hypothetical protein
MIGDTKYTFGANQYSSFWRAGPKDGTIVCSKDYPHGSDYPYRSGINVQPTFEKAADFARRSAKNEYERALAVVQRYEAEAPAPPATR